tara:strand:+ start:57 stop:314 length:258 start_codon:yes stop_codon:yes gene_type:complete
MINENLSKSDLNKIKSLIRKELRAYEKEKLKDLIKKTVKKEFKNIEDIDPKAEDKIEKISKEVLKAFYDMLYKQPYILNKVKRKK